jgi:hypothetical protein
MTSRSERGRSAVSKPTVEWTLLLYIAGLKSAGPDGDGFARAETRLLNELADVDVGPNVQIFYEMSTNEGLRRGRISGNQAGLEPIEKGRPASPTSEALKSFLDWAHEKFPPSAKTALVVKGHGGGLERPARRGEKSQYLGVRALRSALEESRLGKVDVCGLDACDMGLLEVAYELRDVATHVVATQSVEPTTAWPYKKSIELLGAGGVDPPTFAKFVASANKGAFLASTDAKQLDALAASLSQIALRLRGALRADPKRVAGVRDSLTSFGVENQYVDLKQLFSALGGVIGDDALLLDAQKELARDCTAPWPMSLAGGTGAGGLSIFFPRSSGSSYLANYRRMKLAEENHWGQFVTDFCSPSPGTPATGT